MDRKRPKNIQRKPSLGEYNWRPVQYIGKLIGRLLFGLVCIVLLGFAVQIGCNISNHLYHKFGYEILNIDYIKSAAKEQAKKTVRQSMLEDKEFRDRVFLAWFTAYLDYRDGSLSTRGDKAHAKKRSFEEELRKFSEYLVEYYDIHTSLITILHKQNMGRVTGGTQ